MCYRHFRSANVTSPQRLSYRVRDAAGMELPAMAATTRGLDIKVPDRLRARTDACAQPVGATVPEFVREAIRDTCAEVERLHGRRSPAEKAAAREAGA